MNISVKHGNSQQMLELWNGRYESFVESYIKNIDSGIQEIWLMKDEETNLFIGEIHIMWDCNDKSQANGLDTAYLLSLEVNPAFQGKKLGSVLIRRALQRIKEKGYTKATIGADDADGKKLCAMYKSWGFTKELKRNSFEYIENGKTVICSYSLLLNDTL
ncbi:MAG: GNAT family N-acetyltransferase [Aminipila sp.]